MRKIMSELYVAPRPPYNMPYLKMPMRCFGIAVITLYVATLLYTAKLNISVHRKF